MILIYRMKQSHSVTCGLCIFLVLPSPNIDYFFGSQGPLRYYYCPGIIFLLVGSFEADGLSLHSYRLTSVLGPS